jgi:4a-hydroxytetrahydrobiopterin dehydratase
MRTLAREALAAALVDLPGWVGSTTLIEREFTAPDFPTGIQLVVHAGEAAEELDHHPDIDVRWVRVRFVLSTHSAGGVTTLDIELARRISDYADVLGCR